MSKNFVKRVLSGVQPTGGLHIGNYLGAIKNFVDMQNDGECFFCIVDLHAITVWQDPKLLDMQKREVAAAFIASVTSFSVLLSKAEVASSKTKI